MKKFERNLLNVLACPMCKGKLMLHVPNAGKSAEKQELVCRFDKVAYPIIDGIPKLLSSETRSLTLEELEKVPKL
ncbi:MAG: Trm112 family protein [Alteromonadaceae bacterium]|nr:Trm112 family protein [Alteromonadaceae bacterium]